MGLSDSLPVAPHSQGGKCNCNQGKGLQFIDNVCNARPLKHYHAIDLHKVSNRIDNIEPAGPQGHALGGCEYAAHKYEYHCEEESDEHELLLSIREG